MPIGSRVYRVYLSVLTLLLASVPQAQEAPPPPTKTALEEIYIWSQKMDRGGAGYTNPTSLLTTEDMQSINVTTTEDLVKYEPSLVIRRRYIGDSNGTLGMRGANMFQTSRSMVFADGVPLHYLLQSRWNGAPRWTMVSASEIAQIEVIYGPFSAEYSGNAMGGVVVIETAIPQKQEAHFDGTFFSQDFAAYGFDDTLNGFKGFASYANKVGNLSYYLSYNHLDSDAQPQTYRYGNEFALDNPDRNSNPPLISGAIIGNDEVGRPHIYFGDTGIIDTTTNNVKMKLGYDFGRWTTLLNIAFEDRYSNNTPTSYVRDGDGQFIWSGDVRTEDTGFNIPANRLNVSELDRASLSLGLRLKGNLRDGIDLEANISQFDIQRDRDASSEVNPSDPSYTLDGQVSDLEGSGWQTAEVKLRFTDLGTQGLNLVSGLRHETYQLRNRVYASANYTLAEQTTLADANGGDTAITALFVQANWQLNPAWDISIGGRYEDFHSRDGYYAANDQATAEPALQPTPEISANHFSPKFSVGLKPSENWLLRYSVARAYRFPIVEELFRQYSAYNSINEANPELQPEAGVHQNWMLDYNLDNGYMRLNVFTETIRNAIESQSATTSSGSVNTFVPIDTMRTRGVEWIVNQYDALNDLDIRFNLVFTDAKIIRNATAEGNSSSTIEGNVYPRMPKWRGNLLATYHFSDELEASFSVQYATDSFGRIDNSDTEKHVYGAQDGYTRLGAKTTYQASQQWRLGLGIDNIRNEIAYVAHPWPGRTLYLTCSYDLR